MSLSGRDAANETWTQICGRMPARNLALAITVLADGVPIQKAAKRSNLHKADAASVIQSTVVTLCFGLEGAINHAVRERVPFRDREHLPVPVSLASALS